MHYNYKSDKNILQTLIHRNVLPTKHNRKIKLILNYDRFKTSNLVINYNFSPSIGVLQKISVIYQFRCSLGYIRWFNFHNPFNTTHYASLWYQSNSPTSKKKTFLLNNWISKNSYKKHNNIRAKKITNKNYRFSKRSILETNTVDSIEIILDPVLMYSNIFSRFCYLQNQI